MNTLEKWGFRSDWWRNQRGEYWVIGQMILSVGFILLPVVPIASVPVIVRAIGAVILGLFALGLGGGGLFYLGENLTPLPHPRDDSFLVKDGVYGWVRHPIYSSVIFLALAYAVWQMSVSHAIGVLVLFIFFDRKAAQEEQWLITKFPEYPKYQESVKKFIPGIY
ncbi:MAG: isoprenylcysteine carboxylmethyltransferase family protein [Gloeomargarita sp. HHBFW_bins_162]